MTDEEIAKRLHKKDIKIFDYIMANYNKLLWAIVGNILNKAGSTEDIEDCISDIYLKLLENPGLYDPQKGSLKSFLVRVGKNLAIDRYRKLTRENTTTMDEHFELYHEDVDILGSILQTESRDNILSAIETIKEPNKEILIRRYFYNEKVKIIAEIMCLPAKEIENRLYQSKLKLKKLLEHEEA